MTILGIIGIIIITLTFFNKKAKEFTTLPEEGKEETPVHDFGFQEEREIKEFYDFSYSEDNNTNEVTEEKESKDKKVLEETGVKKFDLKKAVIYSAVLKRPY
ncbi:MAG: hypothetical protein IJ748_05410 [Bacteroidales bacterium]|nr:hypothetical protein [Bacteroidales bacterium]